MGSFKAKRKEILSAQEDLGGVQEIVKAMQQDVRGAQAAVLRSQTDAAAIQKEIEDQEVCQKYYRRISFK